MRNSISRMLFSRRGSVQPLILIAASLLTVVSISAGKAAAQTLDLAEGVKLTLGERETLLKDGALGLHWFPDLGVGVMDNEPNKLRLIFAAGFTSYLVEGTDLKHLKSARQVLVPGTKGEFDNGDAAVSQVVRFCDRLYAIYHAEDHEGLPVIEGNRLPGYYASVGLAESADNGYTWTKQGRIIRGAKPKEWMAYPRHTARGAGLPGAVEDPGGRYLYLYYTDQSMAERQGTQICLARADLNEGPPLPGNWKKFYKGAFTEPGIGGQETPVVSVYALDQAHALYPHVSYSGYLKKYVMVFNVNRWKEPVNGLPLKQSGIYLTLSTDAVRWSPPVKLVTDFSYPIIGKSLSWEATVIFDNQEGRTGWLVYAHSPKWTNGKNGGTPHYMVGHRLEFQRVDD
jgi:hypothetical protein